MAEVDYIKLRPDRIGWTLLVYTEQGVTEYGLGDVIQFTEEVDRTLGKWLADGPADFHGAWKRPEFQNGWQDAREPTWKDCVCIHGNAVDPGCPYCNRHTNPDLARDIERGK